MLSEVAYILNSFTFFVLLSSGITDLSTIVDICSHRYDYLEFTDARGNKTKYDQKVNTEKWPLRVSFSGGSRLQFVFHSDSSNNEWGYKFKVDNGVDFSVPSFKQAFNILVLSVVGKNIEYSILSHCQI